MKPVTHLMSHVGLIHGFRLLAWDDMALPQGFWNVMEELPNGCWVDKRTDREANYRETVVVRLLKVKWSDVFAAVPTCGNIRCCNPAHLCVTLRNAMSTHPTVEVPR